ncbi:MAG: hypothetical protein ACRENK_02545 [Gemmatimonadaceae bacterium]
MKKTSLFAASALLLASLACTAERALAPQANPASAATNFSAQVSQIPLLFIVDGVRYPKDRVPTLSSDQISAVQVIKGNTALKEYGPDASYGVVIVTTKRASAPRS